VQGRGLTRLGTHDLRVSIARYALESGRGDALCREYAGRVNLFPCRGEPIADAKAVCRRCLVRPECLLYALEYDQPYGVWGGFIAQERSDLTASNTVRQRCPQGRGGSSPTPTRIVRAGRSFAPSLYGAMG